MTKSAEAIARAVADWAIAMWQEDKATGNVGLDGKALRHEQNYQRYHRQYRRRSTPNPQAAETEAKP